MSYKTACPSDFHRDRNEAMRERGMAEQPQSWHHAIRGGLAESDDRMDGVGTEELADLYCPGKTALDITSGEASNEGSRDGILVRFSIEFATSGFCAALGH